MLRFFEDDGLGHRPFFMEDIEILKLCKQPQSKDRGFTILVDKYQKKVYYLVRRMVIDHDDANDLTQDIFIKIWNNIQKFNGDSQLYTWIYRIATNDCINFLNKKKKMLSGDISELADVLPAMEDDPLITGDEITIKFQEAINQLPQKQRVVFNMKYFEELKYEEIQAVTGTTVGALKASYHHAVKKIEEYLLAIKPLH